MDLSDESRPKKYHDNNYSQNLGEWRNAFEEYEFGIQK